MIIWHIEKCSCDVMIYYNVMLMSHMWNVWRHDIILCNNVVRHENIVTSWCNVDVTQIPSYQETVKCLVHLVWRLGTVHTEERQACYKPSHRNPSHSHTPLVSMTTTSMTPTTQQTICYLYVTSKTKHIKTILTVQKRLMSEVQIWHKQYSFMGF